MSALTQRLQELADVPRLTDTQMAEVLAMAEEENARVIACAVRCRHCDHLADSWRILAHGVPGVGR